MLDDLFYKLSIEYTYVTSSHYSIRIILRDQLDLNNDTSQKPISIKATALTFLSSARVVAFSWIVY